jgi:hypothetical protein
MTTLREKGLIECRAIKKILQGMGLRVEGPGYKPLFLPGAHMTTVHKDYFDMFDLLIMGRYHIFGIQVTANEGHKYEKAALLRNAGPPSFVFYPIKIGRRKSYEIILIKGHQEDRQMSMEDFESLIASEI